MIGALSLLDFSDIETIVGIIKKQITKSEYKYYIITWRFFEILQIKSISMISTRFFNQWKFTNMNIRR